MSNSLKVSISAYTIKPARSLDDFLQDIETKVKEAQVAGSAVLVLPEFVGMGLLWSHDQAATVDNTTVAAFYRTVFNPLYDGYKLGMSALAQRHNVTIVGATYWHEVDDKAFNTSFVFRPDGTVLEQDKIHLTRGEKAINTCGGSALNVFEIEGVKCGMYVCYDVQYPELSRHLADQGVEVIFVPTLTETRGAWREWHSGHARALENQMYVCVSPLLGALDIPNDYRTVCIGQAFVACPIDNRFKIDDGTYASAEMNTEALVHTVLDLDLLRLSRAKGEVKQLTDRRPDVYEKLSR